MSTLTPFKRAALGLSVAAAATLAVVPGAAHAYRSYSTAGCFVETDYIGDYIWSLGIGNQSHDLGARPRTIRCNIIDDNSTTSGTTTNNVAWRPNVSAIYVTGYDGNNGTSDGYNVQASVCYVWYDGLGSSCSVAKPLRPTTDVTFTGPFRSALDAAQVNKLKEAFQGDSSFLQIQIPQQGPLGNSIIYGYATY